MLVISTVSDLMYYTYYRVLAFFLIGVATAGPGRD